MLPGGAVLSGNARLPGLSAAALVSAAACPCQIAARHSYDQLAVLARTTAQASEQARSTAARSSSIEWDGAAATFFRERLNASARVAAQLDEQNHDIQLLLCMGG